MEGISPSTPKTPEAVYYDFKNRRAGLIKAFTSDFKKFYDACDPEKEDLCLYGLPSKTWKVDLPAEEVPTEIPEPALGINFARDGMNTQKWLSLVAAQSDSWLMALAFYFAARCGFGASERKRLFTMMNELPTLAEVVALKSSSKDKKSNEESEEKGYNPCKVREPHYQESRQLAGEFQQMKIAGV